VRINSSETSMLITKLESSTGAVLWQEIYSSDTKAGGRIEEITLDPSGDIYAVGIVSGALPGQIAISDTDAAVIRINGNDGKARWTNQFGITEGLSLETVTLDSQGAVIVGGSIFGSFQGNTYLGEGDIFLAKLNKDTGAIEKSKILGTDNVDILSDLVASNGYIYTGAYTGGALQGQVNFGESDIALFALNEWDLSPVWEKQSGMAHSEYAMSIAIDSVGNIVIAGFEEGDMSMDMEMTGFIRKFSSANGTELGITRLPSANGTGHLTINALTLDGVGNSYVGGELHDGASLDTQPPADGIFQDQAGFVASFNNNGILR